MNSPSHYSRHLITYIFMILNNGEFSTLLSIQLSLINNYKRIKEVIFYLSGYKFFSKILTLGFGNEKILPHSAKALQEKCSVRQDFC